MRGGRTYGWMLLAIGLAAQTKDPGATGAQANSAPQIEIKLPEHEFLGLRNAPLTMVELTDYQCPYCRKFRQTVFPELKKEYIDSGKMRFFSRDLPMDQVHPDAHRAAEAGRCAADQHEFWEMREAMGAHPERLDLDSLLADARDLKMDVPQLRNCVESRKYKHAVDEEVVEAQRLGTQGTPSFVIGRTTADGVEGELVQGSRSLADFERRLKALEAKATPVP